MRRVAEALGVKCDHCHVQGNFASDEKRTKRAGRRMFELTLALNRGVVHATTRRPRASRGSAASPATPATRARRSRRARPAQRAAMSDRSPCASGALAVVAMLLAAAPAWAQASPPPQPTVAESPTITVLKGLLVPQFEVEMRHFVQALGVNCGGCHVPRNFASEDNPRKATARRMIEMTRQLNCNVLPRLHPGRGRVDARPRHLLHLPPGRDAAAACAGDAAALTQPATCAPPGSRPAPRSRPRRADCRRSASSSRRIRRSGR